MKPYFRVSSLYFFCFLCYDYTVKLCIGDDFVLREKDTTIKYMFREVNDITPEVVRELGLEGILFDLDNTTVKDATCTADGTQRHNKRLHYSVTSEIWPSRMWMERSASRAMLLSWVIRTMVLPWE